MTEELINLKCFLKGCLRTNTYYLQQIDNVPNNKLATIARYYLTERPFDEYKVYNVWFAMRELIINGFTADPTYYDVMKTVLHNRREYVKVDINTAYDWNKDHDNYLSVKRCILYSLEYINGLINNTCFVAKKLRKLYNDNKLNIDFTDLQSQYISSKLHTNNNVFEKTHKIIDIHDEIVDTYNLLKNWCACNKFDFHKALCANPSRISLLDIIGRVVEDVYENYAFSNKYTADIVHIVWYAFKLWSMLDNNKDHHEHDEIRQILKEHNIVLNDFQRDEYFVVCSIQQSEILLNKYINKFNKDIIHVNTNDVPYELSRVHKYDIHKYHVISNQDMSMYKDALIKYINLFCTSSCVDLSSEELNEWKNAFKMLEDIKIEETPSTDVYGDIPFHDSDDNYWCPTDSD